MMRFAEVITPESRNHKEITADSNDDHQTDPETRSVDDPCQGFPFFTNGLCLVILFHSGTEIY